MLFQFLKTILYSIFSSAIFYSIVIYHPQKKEKTIAKDFLIKQYKHTRTFIVNELLQYLKPTLSLRNDPLDYKKIRELITDQDMEKFRNYDALKFYGLNRDILHELDTLKLVLLSTSASDFVKRNKQSFERVSYLMQWINNFSYNFNFRYQDKDESEYSKLFNKAIDEHVRGISWSKGMTDKDDFVEIIDEAYRASLFTSRTKCLCDFLLQTTIKNF